MGIEINIGALSKCIECFHDESLDSIAQVESSLFIFSTSYVWL